MGFYSSNNVKFMQQRKMLNEQEINNQNQQDKLDEMLAEERGDISSAARYSRLAKRVINSFGEQIMQPSNKLIKTGKPAATDFLADLIKSGQLNDWFNKLKNIDLTGLSKAARLAIGDLKDSDNFNMLIESLNEDFNSILSSNNDQDETIKLLIESLRDHIVGRDNDSVMSEIINRSRSSSETSDTSNISLSLNQFSEKYSEMKDSLDKIKATISMIQPKLEEEISVQIYPNEINKKGEQKKVFGTNMKFIFQIQKDGINIVKQSSNSNKKSFLDPKDIELAKNFNTDLFIKDLIKKANIK